MRIAILLGGLMMTTWLLPAQPAVWVFFGDKGPGAELRLQEPETFLSPAALARRDRQGIAVTPADLPVWPAYVQALQADGWEVVATSRWLNAAVVRPGGRSLFALQAYPAVRGLRRTRTWTKPTTLAGWEEDLPAHSLPDYGEGQVQNEMLHIQALHEQGYDGTGVRLAILDGGFTGVDQMAGFDSLRSQGRLLATRDFVDQDEDVFHSSTHGTHVFSAMAAYAPGSLVGTAPGISVILARTEQVRSETQQEEYNFLQAVEWADSMGADVIHASLGYSTFDGGINSYEYADMNGDSAITTRAVDMAAARGIIFTVAAGNEGNGRWHYITAPCDADSALCIGSVDRYGKLSSFSSVGPTSDGRIKPDVVAMGTRTAVLNPNDRVS
ncbi:MAG: peptidase S8, partial [Bacteroidetes bacterium]